MNEPLLRKIQELILDEPNAFIMMTWYTGKNSIPKNVHSCNTAACIGGWAALLADGKYTTMGRAQEILDLTADEASRLFIVDNWPLELRHRYLWANSKSDEACAGATRIGHFIRTNGTDDGPIQWTKPKTTAEAA